MKITRLGRASGAAEEYFVAAEKLISGNPRQTAWTQYTDPTEKFFAGIWFSEVGKWKISYTEEEFCEILEGCSVITSDDGETMTVSSGDTFVVPAGFVGTWEVVKPTKKRFVIYEAGE